MKHTAALLLLCFTFTLVLPATARTLHDYKKIYDAEVAKLEEAHGKAIRRLNRQYEKDLQVLKEVCKKSGDLDAIVACNEEIERFTTEKTLPSFPGEPPAALEKLCSRYQLAWSEAESLWNRKLLLLIESYTKRLERLKRTLAGDEKLAEAFQVENEIKRARFVLADIAVSEERKKPKEDVADTDTGTGPEPRRGAQPTPPAPPQSITSGEELQKALAKANPHLSGNGSVRFRDGELHEIAFTRGNLSDITPLAGLRIERLSLDSTQVRDLNPLKGIPLTFLNLNNVSTLRDLAPLQGMALGELHISGVPVDDLSPLAGMRLTRLNLCRTNIGDEDLAVLQGMPLQWLTLERTNIRDISALRGLPLNWLNLNHVVKLRDLEALSGIPLQTLHLYATAVNSVDSLKGMPLGELNLGSTQVSDEELHGLSGLPLTRLTLERTNIRDLSGLQGLPLTYLNINWMPKVTDLSAIAGLPLKELHLAGAAVVDLNPLRGMPIGRLNLERTRIKDLEPLRGMPLTWLNLNGCKAVRDLAPLQGMPLSELYLGDTDVADVAPLEGMRLTRANLSGSKVRDISVLKAMDLKYLDLRRTKFADEGTVR